MLSIETILMNHGLNEGGSGGGLTIINGITFPITGLMDGLVFYNTSTKQFFMYVQGQWHFIGGPWLLENISGGSDGGICNIFIDQDGERKRIIWGYNSELNCLKATINDAPL